MESVIDGAVRGENGERENEVIVGADDAELVHGSVVRCDMRLYDFFGFFLEVVECVGVKVVISPTCNHEADVRRRIFVVTVTFLVLFVPADGVNFRGIMREGGLTAALCDVETSLLCAEVLGVRVGEFVCADELLTDGNGLSYPISWLSADGIRLFVFPVGERCFFTRLTVVAFAVADDENGFFVAADALEHVCNVCKADGV